MPYYRRKGKLENPLTPEDFKKAFFEGHFAKSFHKGFFVLLYYLGIRNTEARNLKKEDIRITDKDIFVSITRLKRSKNTPAIRLPINLLGIPELITAVNDTETGELIFPFSRRTGYNIIYRCLESYPHYLRLSRITNFSKKYSIAELKNYFGLSGITFDYYIGLVTTDKMSESLVKEHQE